MDNINIYINVDINKNRINRFIEEKRKKDKMCFVLVMFLVKKIDRQLNRIVVTIIKNINY